MEIPLLWDVLRLDLVHSTHFFTPCPVLESFLEDLELTRLPWSLELHSWAQHHHPKGSQRSQKPWPGITPWIHTKNGGEGAVLALWKGEIEQEDAPQSCFLKLLLNNHRTNPAQAELAP